MEKSYTITKEEMIEIMSFGAEVYYTIQKEFDRYYYAGKKFGWLRA